AAGRPSRVGDFSGDPVRVRPLPPTRPGWAAAARRLRGGDGRILQCTGHRFAEAGVDVLGSAAIVAVPTVDLVGDDAPAGGRAALDPGAWHVQPADLHRGRGARAVLRDIRRS